jgi:hypothetical protein
MTPSPIRPGRRVRVTGTKWPAEWSWTVLSRLDDGRLTVRHDDVRGDFDVTMAVHLEQLIP